MDNTGRAVVTPSGRLPMADAHHHLWDLSRFRYAWLEGDGDDAITDFLGDYGSIRVDYLIGELERDYAAAGITSSVHVQADISAEDPVIETAWLQDIGDVHGFPHAIVAYTDLRANDVSFQLDRHCEHSRVRGLRLPETEGLHRDGALHRGIRALAERGLSLQVDVPPAQMGELADLAGAFPGVHFVLGHTGLPEERTADYFESWRRAIRLVAERDNVVVKISGLGMRDRAWTIASIRPYVAETIEAFGVSRCMFGTNWPVDRLYSDIVTLVDSYRTIISGWSVLEQQDLLRHNTERFYRISV